MKSDSYFEVYAEHAYEAYQQIIKEAGYKGLPTDEWKHVSITIHQAWIAAVRKVFEVLHVRDMDTGELYATEGVFNQIDEGQHKGNI